VVVAPQVPKNLADLALVTAHHGSTLAGGRLSTRIIEFCIRMVWESCSGGIALSSAALKFIKAALLCVRPVVRTTVRMLMDFLRGLLPETIAILGPHLTNETTPAGHAQAPISGAHTVLGEVPETAPEATSPSSTNETSALVLHQTPTVQSEPEASEERHSASGKDHSEVVSAPAKLKTAELQSDIEASKPLHSATGKYHISTVTKPTVVGSQSSPNFQKRLHSPITTPTLFWTGRRTLASPRSRLQFPGLIARPSGFDNFLGANDVSSREELAEPSTIIMKYDSGHDDRQLAPLGDFWATNLPVLLDRDGRELPVHNLRQLDLESSAKCHALVQRFGPTYSATGAMVLCEGDQIYLAVRVEAQQWSVGALMTAFSSGSESTWTNITMIYESGDSPWMWDYTDVLFGPDVEFEPTAVLASDVFMNDAIDESENDDDVTMASDSGDDGNGGGNDYHDDFFDGGDGGTGGGAVQATAQSTQSD
jgi:hypothetical protein